MFGFVSNELLPDLKSVKPCRANRRSIDSWFYNWDITFDISHFTFQISDFTFHISHFRFTLQVSLFRFVCHSFKIARLSSNIGSHLSDFTVNILDFPVPITKVFQYKRPYFIFPISILYIALHSSHSTWLIIDYTA